MKDLELDLLKNAEFKEAFDEFDKVALSHRVVQVKDQDGNWVKRICYKLSLWRHSPNLGSNCNWSIPLSNQHPFPMSMFTMLRMAVGPYQLASCWRWWGRWVRIQRRMRLLPSLRNFIFYLPNLVLNLHQVLNMMMEADLDGNGSIEFPEFLELMTKK